jgi:hypothetical protein
MSMVRRSHLLVDSGWAVVLVVAIASGPLHTGRVATNALAIDCPGPSRGSRVADVNWAPGAGVQSAPEFAERCEVPRASHRAPLLPTDRP